MEQNSFSRIETQKLMQETVNKHNLELRGKNDTKRIVETYYKFMMYRNPVERLISGYRDKIEKIPMFGLKNNEPSRNGIKKDIYKYKHPDLYRAWKDKGGRTLVNNSFTDFIDYWIHADGIKRDDHFKPIIDICNPCYIHYSYYGEFNSFERSAQVFMNRIGANTSLVTDYHWSVDSGKTSNITAKYYNQLSIEQKTGIVDILAKDLCFYYTLFPKQKDKHKLIMDIDYDIPCTTS